MGETGWREIQGEAWRAVAGEGAAPAEVVLVDVAGRPPGDASPPLLPSGLPVLDTAVACVGAALLAAEALRGGSGPVTLDPVHVAAAVRSEAYLRVDGRPVGAGFAPLSRFWRGADGWIRTHANYPWHRAALLAALDAGGEGEAAGGGAGDGAELVDRVAAALAGLPVEEAETRVVEAGGVAAAVRARDRWAAHPHGRSVAGQPLIATTGWDTRNRPGRRPGVDPTAPPATGIRVLDLTRVIAGPVATRYLAALGADVLRLDPPHRPELPLHRYDGLPGKHSALLDADTVAGFDRLHELLTRADVLVHGYRPGALRRFGLAPDDLAERHPGLVVVALSAWGGPGPWEGRRGFDSLVQAASGIAVHESADGDRPGALPCQLLDHGTGYLCAAAALDGLRRRDREGGTWVRELALARTAHWLLLDRPAGPGEPVAAGSGGASLVGSGEPAARPGVGSSGPSGGLVPGPDSVPRVRLDSDAGPVSAVGPPGTLPGIVPRWPDRTIRYGLDPASWSPTG